MSDTDDLLPWLRAQIAGTERSAIEALGAGATWVVRYDDEDHSLIGGTPDFDVAETIGNLADLFAAHIVRHDPRAVLAQCEAHTAILDLYDLVIDRASIDLKDDDGVLLTHPIARRRMRDVVKRLALTYQHCPGYQEAWRP